jgi:energy-coupling factor transporter ATP-binding protein EcfA2
MQERDRLFGIVRTLSAKGLLVLFVSHRLDEVFEITDRVTVLRNGRRVFEAATAQVARSELVRHMVGHEVDERTAPARPTTSASETLTIRVEGRAEPVRRSAPAPGEILGLGGLVGAGRTRLARRLAGLEPGVAARYRYANGEAFTVRSVRDAIAHGVVYLTEDRKRDGLFLNLPVASNASAAALASIARLGFLSRRASMRRSRRCSSIASRRRVAARAGAVAERRQSAKGPVRPRAAGPAARARLRRTDARRRRRGTRGDLRADRIARAFRRCDRAGLLRSEGAARLRPPHLGRPGGAGGRRAPAGRAGARHRGGVCAERCARASTLERGLLPPAARASRARESPKMDALPICTERHVGAVLPRVDVERARRH